MTAEKALSSSPLTTSIFTLRIIGSHGLDIGTHTTNYGLDRTVDRCGSLSIDSRQH